MTVLAALAVALAVAGSVVTTAPPDTPAPQSSATATAPPKAPPASIPSVPPGDLSAVPPLPDGLMLPVARDDQGETFLVLDRVGKDGDTADFWTYEVFIPPLPLRPGVSAAQGLAHHAVDCTAKTDQTIASAGYDENGRPVVALAASPVSPLAAGSAYALIAAVVCRGEKPPTTGAIRGHVAALAEALGIQTSGR